MSHRQRGFYRNLLRKKEEELLAVLQNRQDIAIAERAPDVMDEVLLANDRDQAIDSLDREATLLRKVRWALTSLDAGIYGVCLQCEEEIPQRRLRAVPWACLCRACQEEADWHEQEGRTFLAGATYGRAA